MSDLSKCAHFDCLLVRETKRVNTEARKRSSEPVMIYCFDQNVHKIRTDGAQWSTLHTCNRPPKKSIYSHLTYVHGI